ncbi:MAG: hypothetical protein IKZ86_07455 [Spirochaetaceae bacterium]|nr:hypothetical protein [Spirochaetaceae bacterium]
MKKRAQCNISKELLIGLHNSLPSINIIPKNKNVKKIEKNAKARNYKSDT